MRDFKLTLVSLAALERTRLAMVVLQDDATREYAYGPAQGWPDS